MAVWGEGFGVIHGESLPQGAAFPIARLLWTFCDLSHPPQALYMLHPPPAPAQGFLGAPGRGREEGLRPHQGAGHAAPQL